MAAPINLEDLAKLKTFVEFVAANPTILNLPQLDFFKKLIEQLGGTVPEGTFQMPAGAKCPFGGDVKSENKSASPPTAAEEDEEVISEMEAESEESEVELDMEANNMNVLEPNIIYLDEKPPKIVKTKKISNIKKSAKKATIKMKFKKKLLKKQTSKLKQEHKVKQELSLLKETEKKSENNDPDDPLYTAKVEVKCEIDEDNQNNTFQYECEVDEPYYDYEYEKMDSKLEKCFGDDDDEDEYYDESEGGSDDESLIVVSRRKGRPRKKLKTNKDKIKVPRSVECRELCKQHCTEKFSEVQRKSICSFFWNLSKEDRLMFIRKHTRARRLTRMKRVNANRSRGNNCCYYLKNYSIGGDETIPELSTDLIRVCRKFFEATLCTTNHYIKKANDGSILEIEQDLLLLEEIRLAKAKENEKSKEPKQILDSETGNLITLEPNQTSKPKISQNKNPSKKSVRRKKGDPEPEHFPKPIKCQLRCIHKCHTKFSEEKRKEICDFFWSLDYKRRKDFILSSMEIKDTETQTTPDFRKSNRPPRSYHARFFMRSGGTRGENLRVCKDFYGKTLCVNRYFIQNAIEFADKTTGCYTGTDRRGVHGAHNKKPDEIKQIVLNDIESYAYWIPNKKSKTKYLHHSLTIKKMHETYKEKCLAKKIDYVSRHYYYRAMHANYNLLFLASPNPKRGGGFLKSNPNISHYTGEEPGGCWIDIKGNKLDLRSINPAQPLDGQLYLMADNSVNSSLMANSFVSGTSTHSLNIVMPVKSIGNQPPPAHAMVRANLNPAPYGNIPQDSLNMFRML